MFWTQEMSKRPRLYPQEVGREQEEVLKTLLLVRGATQVNMAEYYRENYYLSGKEGGSNHKE
jgi:hypothetical protein